MVFGHPKIYFFLNSLLTKILEIKVALFIILIIISPCGDHCKYTHRFWCSQKKILKPNSWQINISQIPYFETKHSIYLKGKKTKQTNRQYAFEWICYFGEMFEGKSVIGFVIFHCKLFSLLFA